MRTLLILLSGILATAQTQYFTTTYAGSVPPLANPVALKQYLDAPQAVAYDAHGNLYYANDTQIWRLNPDGTDILIAGKSTTSGTSSAGNGLATDATFTGITQMAFDPQGNLWIADSGIFRMTPDQKIALILPQKNIYFPVGGIAFSIDAAGDLYAAGFNQPAIMKYAVANQTWSVAAPIPNGFVYAMAISGSILYFDATTSMNTLQLDLQTGQITTAFQSGGDMAVGPDGTIYFAQDSQIFRAQPGGALQPFAGTGVLGYTGDGGPATQASLNMYVGIAAPGLVAANPVNGDVAFVQIFNHVVRVISGATHIIQTVAGASHGAGDNGPAVLAQLDASNGGGGLAADAAGNVYVFDKNNARIRKITPSGIISTVAGNGSAGNSGDGGKATLAAINGFAPQNLFYGYGNITVDKAGNLYFVNDDKASTVRMVDVNGNIHTVAGGGTAAISNGAAATSVSLGEAYWIAVDSAGNLYIAQAGLFNGYYTGFGYILKVSSGVISVMAGTTGQGSAPDGTPATQAAFNVIPSMAVNNSGQVYFVDGNLIRMINAQGNLVTIAGVTTSLFNGNPVTSGPAKSTNLNAPQSLTFDASGNLYFVNTTTFGPQIVMVDTAGNLTPIAGDVPANGTYETTSGDDGPASNAGFASIQGLAVDPSGNIFALDSGAYIRELSPYNPSAPPPYLSAGGVVGSGASLPAVVAVSPNGDATIYGGNFGITHTLAASDLVNGKVPTTLAGVCASFGGVPAALLGVYPGQINVQVPALPPGPVTVQVTLNCGKSNAVVTNFAGVVVQTASPEFFTFLPDPVAGNNPVAAVNAITGVLIGPPGLTAGATFVPAKAGDIVEAFGTGWGSTTPSFGLGIIPGAAGQLALPYTLTFGGVAVPASNIQYAGVAPCCAGLYQINFTVPAGTPSGNQKLVITVGGFASPPNAYITVN